MLSEAVNAYVEVPKTTMLRTLVGMMTILWIFEWVLKGGLARHYSIAHYLTRLWNWVTEQPSRWVVVAATFYVIAAIIATLLSQNFYISVWGEVSGQFGYLGYTTVSYFLLFAIVATHLKTQTQMWRLLGVIVITGVLIGIYGVVQHYGGDPLDLGEAGSERISATMANPVFAGSALVITALLTIGVGLAVLNRWGWTPLRATAWVVVIAIQLMAVFWTGSPGIIPCGSRHSGSAGFAGPGQLNLWARRVRKVFPDDRGGVTDCLGSCRPDSISVPRPRGAVVNQPPPLVRWGNGYLPLGK